MKDFVERRLEREGIDTDIIIEAESRPEQPSVHLACRNCGQEYYTKLRHTQYGCLACGMAHEEWGQDPSLFKLLDE